LIFRILLAILFGLLIYLAIKGIKFLLNLAREITRQNERMTRSFRERDRRDVVDADFEVIESERLEENRDEENDRGAPR
jgi:hypothetical protein